MKSPGCSEQLAGLRENSCLEIKYDSTAFPKSTVVVDGAAQWELLVFKIERIVEAEQLLDLDTASTDFVASRTNDCSNGASTAAASEGYRQSFAKILHLSLEAFCTVFHFL